MSAKVGITGVSIGTGQGRWRGVTSRRPHHESETRVKIELGISNVRGGTDTIEAAFNHLQASGEIKSYYLGFTGAVPHVICEPGLDTVRKVLLSGKVENRFVTNFRDQLSKLLDEIGAKQK